MKLGPIISCVHHPELLVDVYQILSGRVMCACCVCSVCVSMWNLRCQAGSLPMGQSYDEQLSTRSTL